jgi:hypothetical protein
MVMLAVLAVLAATAGYSDRMEAFRWKAHYADHAGTLLLPVSSLRCQPWQRGCALETNPALPQEPMRPYHVPVFLL